MKRGWYNVWFLAIQSPTSSPDITANGHYLLTASTCREETNGSWYSKKEWASQTFADKLLTARKAFEDLRGSVPDAVFNAWLDLSGEDEEDIRKDELTDRLLSIFASALPDQYTRLMKAASCLVAVQRRLYDFYLRISQSRMSCNKLARIMWNGLRGAMADLYLLFDLINQKGGHAIRASSLKDVVNCSFSGLFI